ncbi:MAG: ABC transporter permease [Lachnospiraceae bacterium]|jgi:ribose transport system permease protein|nr:ABC transporter permease [Lachnospiraceae bacterium]MCI8996056.1 ABC transporter permease [Lachnospiraceae bacterium]MCI9134815.1 ABC transporter permease [Lachnospiraceae bacterium]
MNRTKQILGEQKTLLALLILCIFMSIFSNVFLTGANLTAVLIQVSIYGITACGMTFAIIGGEFDLSVGSTMAMTGLLSVVLEPALGQIPAIFAALLAACLAGALNGFLIARCKINSFIATIGTMYIIKGVALRISDGRPVQSACAWYQKIGNGWLLGIPVMVWVLLACVLATAYILRQTRFGRNVYTIGGSSEVAHNSGISVVKCKTVIFIICGFTAGIAGILNASRLNTGAATHGETLALSVITGTVIGGTSLVGGVGNVWKTMVGILFFNVLTNALNILRVYSYYQTAIRGILLVAIIALESYQVYQKQRY